MALWVLTEVIGDVFLLIALTSLALKYSNFSYACINVYIYLTGSFQTLRCRKIYDLPTVLLVFHQRMTSEHSPHVCFASKLKNVTVKLMLVMNQAVFALVPFIHDEHSSKTHFAQLSRGRPWMANSFAQAVVWLVGLDENEHCPRDICKQLNAAWKNDVLTLHRRDAFVSYAPNNQLAFKLKRTSVVISDTSVSGIIQSRTDRPHVRHTVSTPDQTLVTPSTATMQLSQTEGALKSLKPVVPNIGVAKGA